jgi:acetyl esterase
MRTLHTRRKFWRLMAAICLLTFASVAATAQTPPLEIKKKLTEQGWERGVSSDQLYDKELDAAAPKSGFKVTKDLPYGKLERQKVDVYQPEGKSNLPILVFFHGGGYTASARDTSAYIHSNIMYYFARNGFLAVNADYRLAPEFQWPSGGEDVRDVVKWVKANANKYGGDPSRIYLFGHSAGASHVAQYTFDRRFQPDTGPGIAGSILLSGRYNLHPDPDDPSLTGGVTQYFGAEHSRWPSRSVTNHVAESHVPVMLAISEFDQLNLVGTTGELFVELCKRDGGRCPRLLQLKYYNHGTEFGHLNTADDYFGREILEWISEGFAATRHAPGSKAAGRAG